MNKPAEVADREKSKNEQKTPEHRDETPAFRSGLRVGVGRQPLDGGGPHQPYP